MKAVEGNRNNRSRKVVVRNPVDVRKTIFLCVGILQELGWTQTGPSLR